MFHFIIQPSNIKQGGSHWNSQKNNNGIQYFYLKNKTKQNKNKKT